MPWPRQMLAPMRWDSTFTRAVRAISLQKLHEGSSIVCGSDYPNLLNVGVFVNEALDELEEIAQIAGVSALQLHGHETPEYCKALQGHHLIKVFSASDRFTPRTVLDYDVQAIMLDAADKEAFGGTGKLSNWAVARETRELVPKLFLAGGLSPENVADAINQVNPFAVDACSRLESASRAEGPNPRARVRCSGPCGDT